MDDPELDPCAPAPPPRMEELPYDDGEPMESARHRQQMALLVEILRWHYRDRPDVFVGGNMAVYFSAFEAQRPAFKAPDFFAVLNARTDRERTSWVSWEEGGATPDVIIELLSASTERDDRGRKMRLYAQAHVGAYYLYRPGEPEAEGFTRDSGGGWRLVTPTAEGSLICPPLGLYLRVVPSEYEGIGGVWLRWARQDGSLLPTPAEAERERADAERERADAERQRADAERQRADAAADELARLKARLRAAGLDPEG